MGDRDSTHMQLAPMTITAANRWVARYHRHNRPVQGSLFALGAAKRRRRVGAAIVGRPIARHQDDGTTVEVRRVVTDGTKNANSFLFAACWRAAQALGYRRILTYTLQTESGASLRAVGWVPTPITGRSWNVPSRPRKDRAVSLLDKYRWEARL